MSFEQTRDILRSIGGFYSQVRLLYEHLGQETTDEQLQALLERLIQQERRMENGIAEYQKKAPSSVLNTFFQQSPTRRLLLTLSEVDTSMLTSTDRVANQAMRFNSTLKMVYKGLADGTMSEEVGQIFTGLLQMEKQKERELSWYTG